MEAGAKDDTDNAVTPVCQTGETDKHEWGGAVCNTMCLPNMGVAPVFSVLSHFSFWIPEGGR